MRAIVKAAVFTVVLCGAAFAAASAAETAPAGDPGQEIKEGAVAFGHGVRDGAVKFGHGVRDGAVKAWGATKSAVHNGGKAADKPQKRAPQKETPAAEK